MFYIAASSFSRIDISKAWVINAFDFNTRLLCSYVSTERLFSVIRFCSVAKDSKAHFQLICSSMFLKYCGLCVQQPSFNLSKKLWKIGSSATVHLLFRLTYRQKTGILK